MACHRFYFSVANTRAGQAYRFNILNLYKADSLSNAGLRPLLYSTVASRDARTPVGWRRAGEDIAYYTNRSEYANRSG